MKVLQYISDAVILAVGTAAGLATIYFLGHPTLFLWNPFNKFVLLGGSFVLVIGALILWHAAARIRLQGACSMLSLIISLYFIEFLLTVGGNEFLLPRGFDTRKKVDVIAAMRDEGIYAYPSIHPNLLIEHDLSLGNGEILPLAGIGNVRTVFCNELGRYYIYDSDRYGFANPESSWDYHPDLALIGDSFTHGYCVPGGKSYAELLRSHFPLLNLGMNGDGPLVELAVLREYVADLRPRNVLWIYFEGNDAEDLSIELNDPILRRYFNDRSYSQELTSRADKINSALSQEVDEQFRREVAQEHASWWRSAAEKVWSERGLWLRLWRVRSLLGLVDLKREWPLHRFDPRVTDHEAREAFSKILSEAQERVSAWNGKLTFVYVPAFRNFSHEIEHPWRRWVIETVASKNIPLLDLYDEIAYRPDPKALYALHHDGHFNEVGSAIVADAIARYLTTPTPVQVAHGGGIPALSPKLSPSLRLGSLASAGPAE